MSIHSLAAGATTFRYISLVTPMTADRLRKRIGKKDSAEGFAGHSLILDAPVPSRPVVDVKPDEMFRTLQRVYAEGKDGGSVVTAGFGALGLGAGRCAPTGTSSLAGGSTSSPAARPPTR